MSTSHLSPQSSEIYVEKEKFKELTVGNDSKETVFLRHGKGITHVNSQRI